MWKWAGEDGRLLKSLSGFFCVANENVADTAVFAEAFHVAFDGEAFGFKIAKCAFTLRKEFDL